MRTRAGYCGGRTASPTYQSIGDHTEVISIDFDPDLITFQQVLSCFWDSHHSLRNHPSSQYRNVLFYRSDAQEAIARASFQAESERHGVAVESIQTHLEPVTEFTYAERYHQSYYLTRYHDLRAFLEETYPDEKSLADSAVATRLNAFLGSGMERNWETFRDELPAYGLPASMESTLRKVVANH